MDMQDEPSTRESRNRRIGWTLVILMVAVVGFLFILSLLGGAGVFTDSPNKWFRDLPQREIHREGGPAQQAPPTSATPTPAEPQPAP